MRLVDAIPLAALVAIFAASLVRGAAVREAGGDAWAFTEAEGRQRLTGLAFAGSICVSAFAALGSAVAGSRGWPWAGALTALAGAAIVVVAQRQMGKAWRVGVRQGDAPLFVRHGLFRFSRNPIFVGMMLIGFGVALGAATWWSWAAAIAFAASCREQVAIEERHLTASFGRDYIDFCKQVPRWVGFRR